MTEKQKIDTILNGLTLDNQAFEIALRVIIRKLGITSEDFVAEMNNPTNNLTKVAMQTPHIRREILVRINGLLK